MFDWNDEELESIIWGEEAESDDHTVPYPKGTELKPPHVLEDQNKKEWKQENTSFKPEPNTSERKKEFPVCQLENTSNLIANNGHNTSEFCIASLDDLSQSSVSKTDQAEKAPLINHTEILQNRLEDKVHDDFVDYDWANIGSFDDIDRIFSNDDHIFRYASLDNEDNLWSSSKEMGSSACEVPLVPLSADYLSLGIGTSNSASGGIEIETEYAQDRDLTSKPEFSQWGASTSYNLNHGHNTVMDETKYAAVKKPPILRDQSISEMIGKTSKQNSLTPTDNVITLNRLADRVGKRKNIQKCRKRLDENTKRKLLQHSYGPCSQPPFQSLETQVAPPMLRTCPSSLFVQQRHLQGPEAFQYHPISSQHVVPSAYENPSNQPSTMTPQEKIEKLRRRQQMQAMLAIQKQQLQFTNPENQFQFSEGVDADPIYPLEQNDANTISMITDNCSVEETIHQLQDIISKLDTNVRLCIRDSLYRLAQSSGKRHYESDTSSTNKITNAKRDVGSKEKSKIHNSYGTTPDMETKTNPIDRTVAHLLFHRPSEKSRKHPLSHESTNLLNAISKNIQNSNTPCPVFAPQDTDQYINSPENPSNNDPIDELHR